MKKNSKKFLTNLKKARSLIDKIIEMDENNEYCIDIMQQNLAAMGLLKSAHQMFLEDHLGTCFTKIMKSSNEKRKTEMIEEILRVSKLASK